MEQQDSIAVIEQDVQQEIGNSVDQSKVLAANIKDDATRYDAVNFGSIIQSKINRVKEKREDIVPPLRKAYEKVRDFFDDAIRPLESAKRTLAQSVSAYDIEQERQRRLEQERREAQARRLREEYERKQREWEAEQKRIKDEKERQERERKASEERERQRKIREEEDSRIRHAEEAKAQGNEHKIETILERTTAITPATSTRDTETAVEQPRTILPPPPPPPPMPAPIVARRPDESIIARDVWKWSGEDLMALVQAVAINRAPIEYLRFNDSIIGADLRKLKDEFRVPGVKSWKERITSFRSEER